jgi:hypothetical protein
VLVPGDGLVFVGVVFVLECGVALLFRSMFVEPKFSVRFSDVCWVLSTVTGWFNVIPPPPKTGKGPGKPKNPPPPKTDPVG